MIEVNNAAKILGIPFHGWEFSSKSSKSNIETDKLNKCIFVDRTESRTAIKEEHMVQGVKEEDDSSVNSLISKTTKTTKPKLQRDNSKPKNNDVCQVKTERDEHKIHLNKEKNNSMCSKCGKTFAIKNFLKKHLEKRVCERRLAKEKKIHLMMKTAIDIVKAF